MNLQGPFVNHHGKNVADVLPNTGCAGGHNKQRIAQHRPWGTARATYLERLATVGLHRRLNQIPDDSTG